MTAPGAGFDIYGHLAQRPDASAACPHCRGIGGVDRDPEFFLVCKLCGAPRIQMPEGVPLGDLTRASLAKAEAARKNRGMMRAIGLVGLTGFVFGCVVGLPLLFLSPMWALAVLAAVQAPSLGTYFVTRSQREARTKEIAAALDAAWAAAAADVVRAGKAKDGTELARALGVDEARGQSLFMMLAVDAEIGGVRIDTGDAGPKSTIAPDPRFAALEAQADERARVGAANTILAEAEADAEAEAAHHDEKAQTRTP
jgi:hypothetical protein